MKNSPSATAELVTGAIDRFWETIPPIWGEVRNRLRTVAAEDFGITVEQFHVLRLVRKGICSVSELADAKQISRPAISQAVDLLVDKELLTRRQSAADRRYVDLALTPAGEAIIGAIFQKNRQWMREQMADLDAEDLESILRGMDALGKAFGSK